MNKRFLCIVIALLLMSSVAACEPIHIEVPGGSPTSPLMPSQTIASTPIPSPVPTSSPTQIPTETPVQHSGWTDYPEYPSIRDMAFDTRGNLWAAGQEGLVFFQPDGIQRIFTTKDGLPGNDLLSVYVDMQGLVWVGTRNNGVASFDGKEWQTFTVNDGLGANEVTSIAEEEDVYTVLFGTQKGLSVHSEAWGNYDGRSYLPDDAIRDLAVDSSGAIWVGTKEGVTYFQREETYTTNDGLPNNEVNAIAVAPNCSLWVGTSGGVANFKDEQWSSYTTADGLVDNRVSAAAATLDGTVWFGTRSGASRFDGHTWTTYTTADGLAGDEVFSIVVAPDDTLWFGTSGGLSHYSPVQERTPPNASGLQVVYLKDGNLWLWRAGINSQLTRDGRVNSVNMSEDGSKAAFTRMNGTLENELWVINTDGSDERQLVSPEDLAALGEQTKNEMTEKWHMQVVIFHFAWVPGSHTIAYDTRRDVEHGALYHNDLNLVDAETGEKSILLPPGEGGKFIYSPDGSQVAIVTPNNLSIMNEDGSNWRRNLLEYPSIAMYGEAPYYPEPVWSSDSQYMLLALPPKDPYGSPQEPVTLWRIPVDGSPAIRLGEIAPDRFNAHSVVYSPDLAHLAYIAQSHEAPAYTRQLRLANFDGTGEMIVQEGTSIVFLGWSSNGEQFLYSFGKPAVLYTGNINGEFTRLGAKPENVTWVDSDSFLHVQDLGCSLELRLTHLNGDSLVINRMWKLPVSFDYTQ